MATAKNTTTPTVTIKPPRFGFADFHIRGVAPLVIHRFSLKTKEQMKQKMETGKAASSKRNREAKATDDLYEESRYRSPEGWDGFNASSIRAAMISACRLVGFKMTLAKLSVFVEADGRDATEPQIPLIRIDGLPIKQEDMARVETGQPYVTVRAAFHDWAAKIRIRFDMDQFTHEDVANLMARVGLQVGIGEGRPDSKNSAGMGWGVVHHRINGRGAAMKMPAAELVEDLNLYPRNQIDDTHVNDLVRALASGATLPPIVAERSTKRIVDGVHRRRAWLKFGGEDVDVQVTLRDYPSEADFYLDAVRANAGHGRRLDRHDQTRIVLRLQEFHVEPKVIASALHVPEDDVRVLAVRIVYDPGGVPVPQKRGLEHLRGQRLTDDQIAAMKSVRSAEVGRLCIELSKLLDNDLVDYSDRKTFASLKALAGVLTVSLKRFREFKDPEPVSA